MSAPVVRWQFTTSDYQSMMRYGILTEEDRTELISGEVLAMSPIGSRHAACVNRLTHWFTTKLGARAIASVQNPIHISARSEPQPDLALLRPRADFYADALPEPADVWLVIEVADTSVEFDRETKLPLYARAHIAETWLWDLSAHRLLVFTHPTADGYSAMRQLGHGESIAPQAFPDLEIAVSEILG